MGYHYGRIFVTDLGLHKIYMVDLENEDQVTCGYYGSRPGQFSKPTGIVTDDHGNVLLADRDNKRLMLFNKNLQFVKNVEVPDFDCPIESGDELNQDFVEKNAYLLHIFYV